jgi:hypothetical protein
MADGAQYNVEKSIRLTCPPHQLPPEELVPEEGAHPRGLARAQARGGGAGAAVVHDGGHAVEQPAVRARADQHGVAVGAPALRPRGSGTGTGGGGGGGGRRAVGGGATPRGWTRPSFVLLTVLVFVLVFVLVRLTP